MENMKKKPNCDACALNMAGCPPSVICGCIHFANQKVDVVNVADSSSSHVHKHSDGVMWGKGEVLCHTCAKSIHSHCAKGVIGYCGDYLKITSCDTKAASRKITILHHSKCEIDEVLRNDMIDAFIYSQAYLNTITKEESLKIPIPQFVPGDRVRFKLNHKLEAIVITEKAYSYRIAMTRLIVPKLSGNDMVFLSIFDIEGNFNVMAAEPGEIEKVPSGDK